MKYQITRHITITVEANNMPEALKASLKVPKDNWAYTSKVEINERHK